MQPPVKCSCIAICRWHVASPAATAGAGSPTMTSLRSPAWPCFGRSVASTSSGAASFSSFVVPTIAGELKHYFRDRSWTVRPPRDTYELSQRVARSVEELARDLGRSPTPAEVAARVGASVEEVLDARAATDQCRGTSLDAARDEDGYALVDALGVEDGGFQQAEDKADVESLMRGLSARSREILRLRFAEDLCRPRSARASASRRCTSRAWSAKLSRGFARKPSCVHARSPWRAQPELAAGQRNLAPRRATG